jgi:hypothetical protein
VLRNGRLMIVDVIRRASRPALAANLRDPAWTRLMIVDVIRRASRPALAANLRLTRRGHA